ncbi:uncharacterized protein EV422DRAFT_524672 [Fimicolochytrium jonesii]|uniref:uncharacterized protein n=1 Tax=Fimicolochytrium jonesii TaxID=1396493 RepID=UPI0022FEF3F2|nr:uncharacterized protein EV422DRAFT_524672 [Fimicolochytrium jonesii]KAI8822596.1 hypothetical protein EV422DRAFT_524672 [Fimicolochytrium jonesii]
MDPHRECPGFRKGRRMKHEPLGGDSNQVSSKAANSSRRSEHGKSPTSVPCEINFAGIMSTLTEPATMLSVDQSATISPFVRSHTPPLVDLPMQPTTKSPSTRISAVPHTHSTTTNPKIATLLSLPPETLTQIALLTSIPTLSALRLTHRYLARALPTPQHLLNIELTHLLTTYTPDEALGRAVIRGSYLANIKWGAVADIGHEAHVRLVAGVLRRGARWTRAFVYVWGRGAREVGGESEETANEYGVGTAQLAPAVEGNVLAGILGVDFEAEAEGRGGGITEVLDAAGVADRHLLWQIARESSPCSGSIARPIPPSDPTLYGLWLWEVQVVVIRRWCKIFGERGDAEMVRTFIPALGLFEVAALSRCAEVVGEAHRMWSKAR